MSGITPEIEQENLKAFSKLLNQKEYEDEGNKGSRRYYRDGYGNRYYWYVNVQKDGFFHGYIWNVRTKTVGKNRFKRKQKKLLKALLLRKCNRASARAYQSKIKKQERKAAKEALKPVLTKEQIKSQNLKSKILRLQANVKRNRTKMLRCSTRIKTDEKKIKRHEKELLKIA